MAATLLTLTLTAAVALSGATTSRAQATQAPTMPGPTQVLFAGKIIDGIPPETKRVTPGALLKRATNSSLPAYPPAATLTAGSLVQVLVLVGGDGLVANILGVDGPAELTSAASSAVQQWQFRPSGGSDAAAQMVGTVNLVFTPASNGEAAHVMVLPNLARISGGVLAGVNTHKVMPAPFQGHASGTVVLQVVIDPHGAVAAVNPMSGPLALQQAWIEAVSQWRYRPYLLNGEPAWVVSTVVARAN
jgi:outer membrane biosynthesis protein TonB